MKNPVKDPHTVDALQPGSLDSSTPRPDPERLCSPAVTRLVRDQGVAFLDREEPVWPHLRMLGDQVFVDLATDREVYGPYPDSEAAYRATGRVRLETPAGVVLEWTDMVVTLRPHAPPRWDLEDEWSMEVPDVVLSAEVDVNRPGGGSILAVSRWGGLYWVHGDGWPRQLPEDHHPTLEAAWSAYMGGLWIAEGAHVRSRELTPEEVRERFELYAPTGVEEGAVTVNGEKIVLTAASSRCLDTDVRAEERV